MRTLRKPKSTPKRALFGIVFIGFSAVLAYIPSIVSNKPTRSNLSVLRPTTTSPQKKASDVGMPLRLRIPAINVDAAIEYVGLTADGAMDIKKNPDDTAWYELGPRPGDNGSAVIAGHYGWDHQKASVFTELSKLQAGDKLYVDSDKKTNIAFVVRESRKYSPDADATAIFKTNDSNAHLNLITCDGIWNETKKTYSNRLVVFADRA